MAAAEQKISDALQAEVEKVEKECIRPIQMRAFQCSAACCEDRRSSHAAVQGCLQQCMAPLQQAEGALQSQIQTLQDRLTRCGKSCEDSVRDMLAADPSRAAAGRAHMETCVMKCVDNHIPLVSQLMAQYRHSLKC